MFLEVDIHLDVEKDIVQLICLTLAVSNLREVIRDSATFDSISAAVFFVFSKFKTSVGSSSTFSPAEDNRARRSSSRDFKDILKEFCCIVKSDLDFSKSGRSALTTSARS